MVNVSWAGEEVAFDEKNSFFSSLVFVTECRFVSSRIGRRMCKD